MHPMLGTAAIVEGKRQTGHFFRERTWRLYHRVGVTRPAMLPDFERADRIGEFWCYPQSAFAELLIDCEEDRILRAVLVGMLREIERWSPTYAIRPRQGLNLA
jgi:hypothetical protein